MKTQLSIIALAMVLATSNALADDSNTVEEMCAEDCPAYVASDNKDSLTLSDIRQMCGMQNQTSLRLVTDCQGTNTKTK